MSSPAPGLTQIDRNEPTTFVDKQWIFFSLANCYVDCYKSGGALCQGDLNVDYKHAARPPSPRAGRVPPSAAAGAPRERQGRSVRRLTLTNGNTMMTMHFSADEQGILQCAIAFFVMQARGATAAARRLRAQAPGCAAGPAPAFPRARRL